MTLDIKPMLRVFQEIANLIVELIFNLIHFPHNAHGTQRRLLPHVGISRGHPWRPHGSLRPIPAFQLHSSKPERFSFFRYVYHTRSTQGPRSLAFTNKLTLSIIFSTSRANARHISLLPMLPKAHNAKPLTYWLSLAMSFLIEFVTSLKLLGNQQEALKAVPAEQMPIEHNVLQK